MGSRISHVEDTEVGRGCDERVLGSMLALRWDARADEVEILGSGKDDVEVEGCESAVKCTFTYSGG